MLILIHPYYYYVIHIMINSFIWYYLFILKRLDSQRCKTHQHSPSVSLDNACFLRYYLSLILHLSIISQSSYFHPNVLHCLAFYAIIITISFICYSSSCRMCCFRFPCFVRVIHSYMFICVGSCVCAPTSVSPVVWRWWLGGVTAVSSYTIHR
jgi:hypothetical protein